MRAHRLGLLAVAGALSLEWLGHGGGSVGLAAADFVVGASFLCCGFALWRPGQRDPVALLFVAVGLTWFLGTLAGSGAAPLAAIGAAFLYAHRGPLVQLVLSYPSGRPTSRVGLVVIAAAYVDGLVVLLAQDDALTIVLAAAVVAAAAIGVSGSDSSLRPARLRATACATLVEGALVLGAVSRLAGAGLSDTTLLLAYEASLLVSALFLTLGLLADRLRPEAVADLVVELGAAGSETLRGELAKAFGDPSLELGYWVDGVYVDDRGRPVTLPGADSEQAVTRVDLDGEPLAALVCGAALAHDAQLDIAVAAALRLAAANARLHAELQRQVTELRASRRRMIEAGDAQRRRLERRLRQAADVHLEAMRLALERALNGAPAPVATAIELVERELEQAVDEVHRLARGIHPRTLTERGLAAALIELAETAPTSVSVDAPSDRFPQQAEVAAYFVCAEAVANVAKYAHAGHASIEVDRCDGRLRIAVSDDGIGGADPARGSGLRGLADRIDAVGGSLRVTSPLSAGTFVRAEIPLEHPA